MKKILFVFMLVFAFSAVIRADTFELIIDVVDGIADIVESTDKQVSDTSDELVKVEETSTPRLGQYIIDNASLLTDEEVLELEAKSEEINKKYNFDVVILTVPDMSSEMPMTYSSNFFHNNGYNENGIIFLISMLERDWDISTFNYGQDVFTDDYGLDYIINNIVPYLSDGEYNKSFSKFLYYVDAFLLEAESGSPYNLDNKFIQKHTIMIFIAIVAFIISIVVLVLMGFSMNTKVSENFAHEYVNGESINITERNDVFLYRTVTRTAKPKEKSSSGGSGGRISRVGGRSGKF